VLPFDTVHSSGAGFAPLPAQQSPLVLIATAPDPEFLARGQGVDQAGPPYGTAGANSLRPLDLRDGCPGGPNREEKLGIYLAAYRHFLPLHVRAARGERQELGQDSRQILGSGAGHGSSSAVIHVQGAAGDRSNAWQKIRTGSRVAAAQGWWPGVFWRALS
jgi:hypothetical protein